MKEVIKILECHSTTCLWVDHVDVAILSINKINKIIRYQGVVMGPDQIVLTRIRLGYIFAARVWKISPKNYKFLNFFSLGQKNLVSSGQKIPGSKPGPPVIYCGSEVCSGQVRLGQGPSLSKRTSL